MSTAELDELAGRIREFLVEKVSRTGGHLGPNLGVVELTLALHRTFESPNDVILWDTGHQSYVHKIVTGRSGDFDTLRQEGGLSGYPSRAESAHDIIENSHASTALSYADGIAKGFQLTNQDRTVIAVIGDGALTGGMTWEAINNIAEAKDRPVVIVVNDNERSYSPTIGGLAHHLAHLRTTKEYERFLSWGKELLGKTPVVGAPMYEALHGMKKGLKDFVAPQGMFEDLGLKYVGPVDGHSIEDLEFALQRAKEFGGPVIVHVITTKGKGYAPAETDEADRFHAVGIVDPETGQALNLPAPTWTSVFSDELVALGNEREDIVAITAAMLGPTGLDEFARKFPERTFDVGIAEQHAVTSAAGMAFAGLHPVVAIYATFMNRAFDQVLMDCGLHRAGVTFVLDRAGITGDDGASHNGMWDMSLLRIVPNICINAPRDASHIRSALQEAVKISDRPSVVRYAKGSITEDVPGQAFVGESELLFGTGNEDVVILSIGALARDCVQAAKQLAEHGVAVAVIDPVWALPINTELVTYLNGKSLVHTVEDGLVDGGIGSAYAERVTAPVRHSGIPSEFLRTAKRNVLLKDFGLTADGIALTVRNALSHL